MRRTVDHVEMWLDERAARDRIVDAYWSVSECDEDGDEISCDCGSRSRERAWEMARELAEQIGVEAREIDAFGTVTRREVRQ